MHIGGVLTFSAYIYASKCKYSQLMISDEAVKEIKESLTKSLANIPVLNMKPRGVWMTRQETADRLRISLSTLRNWTNREIIPFYKLGGRVLFRIDDIEKAMTRYPPIPPEDTIQNRPPK